MPESCRGNCARPSPCYSDEDGTCNGRNRRGFRKLNAAGFKACRETAENHWNRTRKPGAAHHGVRSPGASYTCDFVKDAIPYGCVYSLRPLSWACEWRRIHSGNYHSIRRLGRERPPDLAQRLSIYEFRQEISRTRRTHDPLEHLPGRTVQFFSIFYSNLLAD